MKPRQSNRMRKVAAWAVVIAMVLFAGGGMFAYFLEARRLGPSPTGSGTLRDEVMDRVKVFPDQGVEHVPDGTRIDDYNSNPPTSGPHYGVAAAWGVYDTELPDEQLVHNLEHCGIWISYRPDIDPAEKAAIEAYGRGYRSKVIVTPRERNEAPIALAAWRFLLEMERFSAAEADVFVGAFLNKAGPECSAQ